MIIVLRLSHRIKRDVRVTTHVCLAARAFGADRLYYSGDRDQEIENNIKEVSDSFGGDFQIEYIKNPLKFVKEFKGIKVHLTMYGYPFQDKLKEIDKTKDILLIIGSEKVPMEYYRESNFNIAVGNTPHSEISALSTILYELNNHKLKDFKNSKIKIIPGSKG